MRNAKQKKNRASQNSEAIFWRPPFHKAPPGRQKSEREFCRSEGFFFSGVPRHIGRLAVLARLAAVAAACVIGVPACVPCCTWRPGGRLAAIVSAFCGVVFRPTLPLLCLVCAAPGLVVVCPLCAEGTGFFAAFSCAAHGKLFLFLPVFRCFVPGLRAAFLPPLRRHFCACLSGLRCLPAMRFVCAVPSCLAVCLPVPCWLHARFSLIFYLLPFPCWL